MTSPARIQRSRTKGWRMPAGAVYVGRPTKWGNPYRVGIGPGTVNGERATVLVTAVGAVAAYRAWLAAEVGAGRLDPRELRGKDLACWCRLDRACHADVLLAWANGQAWENKMSDTKKTKTCIDCKKHLSIDSFYRLHAGHEPRQSRCKKCDNLRRVDEPRLRGPIKCPLCARSFRRVESLRGHLSAHGGRRPRGRVMLSELR